jgi:hypothetical protein
LRHCEEGQVIKDVETLKINDFYQLVYDYGIQNKDNMSAEDQSDDYSMDDERSTESRDNDEIEDLPK